jgi:hypothetical protein
MDPVAGQAGGLGPAQPASGGQQHHRPVAGVNPVREGADLLRGQWVDDRQRGGGQFDAVTRGAGASSPSSIASFSTDLNTAR